MSIITIEILIIFFLTILNGVFAMSEIAVVSARKSRLQQWAESGNKRARLALELSNSPEEFLSTVQVGITLVGISAGAFGGATIAEHLADHFSAFPLLVPYAETLSVVIVVLSITYLSLILGELVPKRIALNNPERIATLVAGPMRFLSRIASPVVKLLGLSTNAILAVLRIRRSPDPAVTEEEIRILVRQSADAGVIEKGERDIVERVFRLGAKRVSTLMTPRKDLDVLFLSDKPDQVLNKILESGHALFPLCDQTLDNVLGVIHTREILTQHLSGKPLNLRSIVREPLFLPESIASLKLLEEFRKTGKETALLLDEYGGLQGLITPSDILRALLGDVATFSTPHALRRPDGSWLVDGMLPLDEFKEIVKLKRLPLEETRSFETVGGFVMALLGRIPVEGDTVSLEHHSLEVVDMDGLRVDKIRMTELKAKDPTRGSQHV
ncbi:MAG: hemolysin family protein [Bacteroidota bacterium]